MAFLTYTEQFDNNLFMLLLRDNERYMPIIKFFDTMTRHLSELSWADAELIAAEISKVNQSDFCTGIRGGMSKALNADSDALLDNKLAAALTFALKVNHSSASITKDDTTAVTNMGWSEQTVEDIVGLVAIQKLYNTIANGLGFKALPEGAFAEIGQDTVSKGSYVVSFEHFISGNA